MRLRDFWRLMAVLLLGLGIGLVIDAVAWSLLAAALLYIAVLHRDLTDLLLWLRNRKSNDPPERPGIFEDVTLEIDYLRERHKKRKKKLASYLKQFQQATRALPDATVVLDDNDEVRWANGAAERTLGVRWPDDVGQRVTNIIRQPALRGYIEDGHVDGDTTVEIESPVNRERVLSILTAPYGTDQRLLVARDVTQLHRANQVRSDFVANVSHELRTPITVFRGYLETLQQQLDVGPDSWRPAIEQMAVHSERMLQLVEELLLLSSLESEDQVPEPTVVDVPHLIAEIHTRATELSGAREHLFALEIDPSIYIRGSRQELFSAFSNLVFNAINYTDERGIIRIKWHRDEDGAHFVVEDNGIGIAEEHVARLTERFYRVDPSRARTTNIGGTGLGLAIAKHVMQRHDGVLSISSKLGAGSRFSADFPHDVVVDAGHDATDDAIGDTG